LVAFERWHHFGRAGMRYLSTYFVPHRNRAGELNGFYSLISDLTSLKRAEESARFVADCGKLLVSSLDYEATARGIVHLAVPRVADLAILWRVKEGALVVAAATHAEDAIELRLATALRTVTVSLGGTHNLAGAARSGLVMVTQDVTASDLERLSDDVDHRDLVRELQIRSALHIPIVVRKKIWAVFTFGASTISGRHFTDQHRSLADEISTRMRLAVENALLHEEAQKEIEERRRVERIGQEAEERFRLLVAAARDYAIILLDPDEAVASWNEGAERILGYGEHEAVGMPISRLYTKEDQVRDAPLDELAKARETGSALEERWYVRKDGTRFWASGHTVVLRNAEGLIRGYAKIMRDLTEWKLTEEDLESRVQQRTLELNEAVQELEAFSYSVSHDLRAPLRSIRGFTELALEEAADRLTEGEKDYLRRVQRAVSRLDQLISDLLAYTRVSKTRVEICPVNLQALVTDLRREHPDFQSPQAEITIEGTLAPVMGNVAYLTQCVTNLLGNAVKFVKPGEVPWVRIWTERRDGTVCLRVRDHGVGIPAEGLSRVFDMFERLHVGGGYEGTGVGLAIVRRAVQRMNGTIWVESNEGDGTTFSIELAAVDSRED
jgi:PAS domain S-box-containing protein